MDWTMVDRWAKQYEDAKRYYESHGDLNIPTKYINEDGIKLGSWVPEQRKIFKLGIFNADRIRRLNEIGMVWATCIHQKTNEYDEMSITMKNSSI